MSRNKTLVDEARLDRLGVAASCACAIHCLITPLLVGLLPLLGLSWFADARTEWSFVALSVLLGLLSLLPGYFRHHQRLRPTIVFMTGICLILIARLWEEGSRIETPVVVIGALMVATAHIINLKLCRACTACTTACV